MLPFLGNLTPPPRYFVLFTLSPPLPLTNKLPWSLQDSFCFYTLISMTLLYFLYLSHRDCSIHIQRANMNSCCTMKRQNIYIKFQFVNSKCLLQATFESVKFQEQFILETANFGGNVKKFLFKKVA